MVRSLLRVPAKHDGRYHNESEDSVRLHEPNSEAIREAMAPGVAVNADRQTGKSSAIIASVHMDYRGRAVIVCHDWKSAHFMQQRYREAFPEDDQPKVIGATAIESAIYGHDLPVYVDEWWLLPTSVQNKLKDSRKVAGAVGSVLHLQQIPL